MADGIDYINIISSLTSGFLGIYLGYFLKERRENKKIKSIRQVAIDALNIIKSYAPKSYKISENQFNKDVKIPEKRIILVALHKLGIPITLNDYRNFDISHISFEDAVINKDEINDIISQIEIGHCDNLFYMDPEKYFNENLLLKYKRLLAKRFINNIFAKTRIGNDEKGNDKPLYPDGWWNLFSVREYDILGILVVKLSNRNYYDPVKKVPIEGIVEKLNKEVDTGLWDAYLEWPYESYANMKALEQVAGTVSQLFLDNMPPRNNS